MSKIEDFKDHFRYERSSMVNKFRFLVLIQLSVTIFLGLEIF